MTSARSSMAMGVLGDCLSSCISLRRASCQLPAPLLYVSNYFEQRKTASRYRELEVEPTRWWIFC